MLKHWLDIGNIFVHIAETDTLFFVLNINGETITTFNMSNNKIVLVYVKKSISFTTSYLKIL